MKRSLDVLLSALALLVLAPLMLAVTLAVFVGDFGPVLFRQRRVGRFGREFSIYKFRSMVLNAERLGSFSTADGDSRITSVGRFIRRTSLDELPQLFNVLLGDMSLVGPRPDVPAQRGMYSGEEWEARHQVRPGITGLAQATLRSAASVEQRKALDLRYAREATIALDLQIIALTFKQVFGKGGN